MLPLALEVLLAAAAQLGQHAVDGLVSLFEGVEVGPDEDLVRVAGEGVAEDTAVLDQQASGRAWDMVKEARLCLVVPFLQLRGVARSKVEVRVAVPAMTAVAELLVALGALDLRPAVVEANVMAGLHEEGDLGQPGRLLARCWPWEVSEGRLVWSKSVSSARPQ